MGAVPNIASWWLVAVLANSLLALGLLLSWCSARGWLDRRHPFYLALAALLALAGMVGFIGVYHYTFAWTIGGIVAIAALAALESQWRKLPTQPRQHFQYLAAFAAVLAVATPSLAAYRSRSGGNRAVAENNHVLETARNLVESEAAEAGRLAQQLSAEDWFRAGLTSQNIAGLTSGCQQFMLSNKLQFLTVTDGAGTVVLRAQQSFTVGDNAYAAMPWLAPAFSGQAVTGTAINEDGAPVVAAAQPIAAAGRLQAVVILGYALSDTFTSAYRAQSGAGLAVADQNGIVTFTPGSNGEAPIYRSSDFNESIRALLAGPQAPDSFQGSFRSENTTYVASGQKLKTLLPSQTVMLLTLTKD